MTTPGNGAGNPVATPAWVKELVFSAVFISAWSYVTGWYYARGYFDSFKVGILPLSIPREFFFVYAMVVVKTWWWVVLMALGIFFLATGLPASRAWIQRHWQGLLPSWRIVLVLMAALLALWIGAQAGRATARTLHDRAYHDGFPELPNVAVVLKEVETKDKPEGKQRQALVQPLLDGCYRLLLHSNDPGRLFLFRHFPGLPVTGTTVEVVREEDVALLRILPGVSGCEMKAAMGM